MNTTLIKIKIKIYILKCLTLLLVHNLLLSYSIYELTQKCQKNQYTLGSGLCKYVIVIADRADIFMEVSPNKDLIQESQPTIITCTAK